MCSIHILFTFKHSYMITFRSLHARNCFTSHCMLCVFCVLITCIIMYAWICADCILSRALKPSLSCLWLYVWISFCVCSRTPLCVALLCVCVCVCPSECLLGCVRVIAWIYLVLCIRVCFYHIISCVYECVYRLLCVFCVRRIVLFVCPHNDIMAHSVWCECVRACTNYKCVCINWFLCVNECVFNHVCVWFYFDSS